MWNSLCKNVLHRSIHHLYAVQLTSNLMYQIKQILFNNKTTFFYESQQLRDY